MFVESKVARFLAVGLGNTLAGVAIIFAGKAIGLGDVSANAIGYAGGLALSFALNRQWTFRHRGPLFGALGRFVAVLLVAYAANLAVVLSAIGWLGINSYVGQVLGVPVYTGLSYVGLRWYVFPDRGNALEPSHDPSGHRRSLL